MTALGNAQSTDASVPKRYIHIGWIAFFERNPGSAAPDTGDYLLRFHFVEWDHTVFYDSDVTSIAGADGFYYSFQPGVTANVVVE